MEVVGGTNVSSCIKELDKQPQIIIGSPGRVLDMIQKNHLFTNNIKTLVFDEADETLSYGFKETIYNIVRTSPKQLKYVYLVRLCPKKLLN